MVSDKYERRVWIDFGAQIYPNAHKQLTTDQKGEVDRFAKKCIEKLHFSDSDDLYCRFLEIHEKYITFINKLQADKTHPIITRILNKLEWIQKDALCSYCPMCHAMASKNKPQSKKHKPDCEFRLLKQLAR